MASAQLHPRSQIVGLADEIEINIDPAANRRLHERVKASDLQWLRSARLKYGSEIRVLDISAGGMLLETETQLTPDGSIVVELTRATSSILVPSRVLRCRVASLGEIISYRGACAFKRLLTIPELARLGDAAATRSSLKPVPVPSAWQKVVARFLDGRMLSGYTCDFHPSKPQLHLSSSPFSKDVTLVPIVQIKALFFVREFVGDPTRDERKEFTDSPQGRKVEVTFHDDEVLLGTTLGYRRDGGGFFVQPADAGSNNLRVFVAAAGVRQFRFI